MGKIDHFGLREPDMASPRLWSLWDMLIAYGHLFTNLIDRIDRLCEVAEADPSGTAKQNRTSGSLGDIHPDLILHTAKELADLVGMESVADQVMKLNKMVTLLNAPLGSLAPEFWQLRVRLQEGLRRKEFLFVPEDMAKLYNKSDPRRGAAKNDPFELGQKFKESHADIASAARCLALGEGTACVFHLSRALEAVVKKLSSRLGITVTHKTPWRVLTNSMDAKIKKMPDDKPDQKRKRNGWELACTNLHHIGSVWRNETMHPAATYTPSQAKDVYDACRVLMNSLARL